MTGFEWERLGARVLDLLDINVVDVLVGGWKAHQDVHRELGRTATDPSRTAMVGLTHHTIDSTHTPAIELRAQGRKVLEVSFPVELTLEIDAVRLTIRGGAIREIHPGEVKVRGTMKLENTVVLERQLSAITLPGRIVLDAPARESASNRRRLQRRCSRADSVTYVSGMKCSPLAQQGHERVFARIVRRKYDRRAVPGLGAAVGVIVTRPYASLETIGRVTCGTANRRRHFRLIGKGVVRAAAVTALVRTTMGVGLAALLPVTPAAAQAQDDPPCTIICSPELKIEPTFTIEHLAPAAAPGGGWRRGASVPRKDL